MGESDQDFIALGDEFVEALTEHAGLRDDSRVLDIGCGYGRLPHALKRSGFAGSYLGIDVLEKHVRWCTSGSASRASVSFTPTSRTSVTTRAGAWPWATSISATSAST